MVYNKNLLLVDQIRLAIEHPQNNSPINAKFGRGNIMKTPDFIYMCNLQNLY